MAKSPAFQFYASDFLTDTQSWDINEVGIYIRLLSNQWVNGSLPKDLIRLSRIAGCTHEEIKKAWVILGFKFLDNIDGSIYNQKLESVREAQTKFKEKQASNGAKGGRPKNDKTQNKPKINPSNNPNDNPNKSSSTSSSINKEIYKENPTLEEFIKYFNDNHYNSELATRAWTGYNENNWKDSQGKVIKSWKTKCQHVWFSEQNSKYKNNVQQLEIGSNWQSP